MKFILAALLSVLALSRAEAESVLLPPPADSSIYDQMWDSLSVAQRHKLSLYGLRLAPLDPRVWGLRIIDVTESKILIPIRPFFLRASEEEDFRVDSIKIEFQFKKTSAAIMERHPREHDPILEIGFASAYSLPAAGELPKEDQGFAARLSAFPSLPSGFFKRERDRYQLLHECAVRTLETGKIYTAELHFSEKNVSLLLDGQVCAALDNHDLRKGLLSLQTSWSPVIFRQVEIRAAQLSTKRKEVSYSGVIDTQQKKRRDG